MKCEKCREKEASFFYTATINGETTQRRLCADCARDEGLDRAFDWGMGGFFNSFACEPFWMHGGFFGGRGLFGEMPAAVMLMPAARPAASSEPAEPRIPADAGGDIRARRELTALKAQLDAAVKDENFERAIELRDKIRELEG